MAADVIDAERHVISCIQALYAHTDPKLAKEADQWLKEFQVASPLAWTVADHILRKVHLPYEVHFYAASTLYMKIQVLASIDLNTVSRAGLRDSLISHISIHCKSNQPLLTKLAQSIAVLALHMGTEWNQVVPDLLASFTRSPDLIKSLFSVLEVLPEESENYHSSSRVSKEIATAFRAQIRHAAPDMVQNLGNPSLLGNANDNVSKAQVMRCFGNWLRCCEDDHLSRALNNNPLMVAAFDALANHELFDSALAAVCELVSVSTHKDFRQLVAYSISRAQGYLPVFKKAVADEDEETVRGLCHLFTEMAESYLTMMLEGDPAVLPLAEVMLECIANTEVEIAAITFRFWQQLGEGLAKSDKKDLVAGFAGSIFPRVFNSLYRLSCYPDDFTTLPKDLQEDFRDTRKNEVATTLRSACAVMGTAACFGYIAAILQKQMGEGGYQTTGNWKLLEGAIFCVRALGRCVEEQSAGAEAVIASILKILPQLPNHKEIHYTSLLIVGRYADWLKSDPSLLWPLFSYVVFALGHSDTAPSAAVSFKNVCSACAKNIADTYLNEILKVAVDTMQSDKLGINDHIEVLDGVCQVISTLPFDSSVNSLQTLCTPLLTTIHRQTQQHQSKSDSSHSSLADNLCKLATILLSIKTFRKHPDKKAPITEGLWPYLEPLFSAFPSDHQVIDQLLRCIRYLLDNFAYAFTITAALSTPAILPPLFANLKATYKVVQNPSILYTSAAFFKYNSQKPEHIPFLWDLLIDLTHTTLTAHAQAHSRGDADAVAHAEAVYEFCTLVEYAVHDFAAQMRATHGLLDRIVAWCSDSVAQISQLSRQDRHQREAFYAICRLLVALCKEGVDFTTTGEGLVRALITSLAHSGISYSRASSLCDVLRRLMHNPNANAWISSAFANNEHAIPHNLPHAPKAKFLGALATEATFPVLDQLNSGRKKDKDKENNKNGNGVNGRDHRAEEAERDMVNAAMDFADMCKKFRRN